ncbi:MAG: hypothetical protein MI867_30455 [Pseudomonadales bacterium]|nr:hypothetical protein [Pseudomonadales bacterium]
MSEWEVDIAAERAKHTSGVEIIFSGNPESNSFDGKPTGFPPGMGAIEQVTLIRTGFEAYREAYQANPRAQKPRSKPQAPKRKPVIKSKSDRPVMSLKRASQENA